MHKKEGMLGKKNRHIQKRNIFYGNFLKRGKLEDSKCLVKKMSRSAWGTLG